MLQAMNDCAAARRSRSTTRRASVVSTPYDSLKSEESFSSFSDDSDGGRARRSRRKAVTKRKPQKPKVKPVVEESGRSLLDVGSRKPVGKPKSKAKTAPKDSPAERAEEIVKMAKKEGPTKFQQMRKFLQKANEAEVPTDFLSGFLSSRRSLSPSMRSSTGSASACDFHTGLTPTSANRRMPSPMVLRRDSDEGFAANDLLLQDGQAVTNRIGTFIHGQRGLNLRRKMKAVAAGDNLKLALMIEEIPNVGEILKKHGKAELRDRVLANTAGEEDDDKENASTLLDDSQLAELEDEMLVGL